MVARTFPCDESQTLRSFLDEGLPEMEQAQLAIRDGYVYA